ncbi:F-box only protein 47-like [Mya arenaria]|uniref:F-box only protein 47-like n=1 Tax=Mya arenaria TaxID=6604 RepID=UPI0022E40F7F|nr:F-box only protein 47-like [Mya arenaria]
MDITHYMPCKKPRRSTRLEFKEKEELKEKSIQNARLGFFDVLPIELKFFILKYMTVEDLSLLTITSKAFRNLVEGYLALNPVLKKEVIDRLHVQSKYLPVPVCKQSDFVMLFSRLGLLVKRSTCLYSTKDRLKFINEVLIKLLCCNRTESCEDLNKCLAMTCFGKFLHTVIAGWDDCECVRTFESICSHTSLMKNVELVLRAKSGGHARLELEIRCFYRRVFLDHCGSLQDRAFWLTRVLKPWPLVYQARLLFLLYGPLLGDEILWCELSENTPVSAAQSSQHIGGLASALQILHHYKQEWSEDDIISIIDELTSSPEEWLAENMAHLLILCGDVITSKLLISKAINGRMLELSSLTTSFCVVCVKNSLNLNYVITMIRHVLTVIDSVKDRQTFFSSIMDMFKELIIDIHEFEEEQANDDMFYMITALVEFTKKIINLAFKDSLS